MQVHMPETPVIKPFLVDELKQLIMNKVIIRKKDIDRT
jgi:hypothetical protein